MNATVFTGSNQERTQVAAERTVAQSKQALKILDANPPQTEVDVWLHILYRSVLEIRARRPHSTLRELGAALSLTKDTYSARLRRALRYAQRKECS